MNLDKAYKNFFRDKSIGFPKFKSKKNPVQSYTTNNQNGTVNIFENWLKVPKLKELVKIKMHRKIEGFMKEIKFLKRILKKRKSFTVQILIAFLITGNIGYGINIFEDFVNETIIKEDNGTALFLKNDYLNITNIGVISGRFADTSTFYDSGNGINAKNIGEISNSGIISGIAVASSGSADSGNGIFSNDSIGNVNNSGIIRGVAQGTNGSYNGSGINAKDIGNVNNSGIISGAERGAGIKSGSLGYVSNNGIISATSDSNSFESDGLYLIFGKSSSTTLGYVSNNGIISGSSMSASGSGISMFDFSFNQINIGNLSNSGIISGFTSTSAISGTPFANGISLVGSNSITVGSINNSGIISGSSTSISGTSGNGIYSKQNIGDIENNGLIKGTNLAINSTFNSLSNNGILAGKIITYSPYTNNGITITLDNIGNITNIENGLGGETLLENGTKKVVINGQRYDENNHTTDQANLAKDSYITANGNNYENNIINGAGINKGALVVKAGTSINDSIVNGYNTAVYLENSSQLTATNTIFNGGGLKNDVAVIKGSTGDNVASISGASIINGAVNLEDGNDTLAIANTVQINGDLNGGLGKDILNLGETSITKVTPNLNILHNITGFENINTNGKITLFETTKITGADKINLESGNLVLRVDPTITANGKVTGHALYENNGTLISNGGNLVIGLNGLGEGTIISMGGTTITPDTDDSWWKDTDHIKTNSLVLDGKLSADGKDINITILESIPLEPSNPAPIEPPSKPPVEIDPPITPPTEPEPPVNPPINPEAPIVVDSLLYEKLNKVYQSIVTSGEIGSLANTTLLENKTYNESLGGLLTILDQMYANNPYAYTVKSSRDSLKLFEDNMSYLTIKPKKDEMVVQGKAIYTGVKNDSGAYGKNYYGFDTGHRNYKITTNTVGGLATFEYGLTDKTSVGVVLGGNNQDINFKGSSKIKGNSLYLGTFAKTDINNFKFMGGVGYQYTSADADRKVSNRYDSFSTGDKYDINSLNAFVEAKYVYNAEQDWTVEPKVRLSYYYIEQDKINEGYTPGQISMRTDKINSNTADVETGVDFVKSLYLNNGKLKNILSLGVINTIGDKSKELNGYILGKEKDGKKFDIQGVELPKTSGKVSYSLELEQTNGMIYTAGVSLEFAKDYNRNVNATIGIGYKF